MSLLELERVTKRDRSAADKRVVLREVSLCVEAGELVAVWGARHSGRTTLLRIAAGIARPDDGAVRFQGKDLATRGGDENRAGIVYCLMRQAPGECKAVLDQLIDDQIICGVGTEVAEEQANQALARAGVKRCATARFNSLDPAEAVRVAVARGLAHDPRLLLIDEPTLGVDLLARDEILLLLRSIADDGVGVLMTTGDTPSLSVADRRLSLDDGELRGSVAPRLADVVPLRQRAG